MSEEDFETGRRLGLVARKDKELYNRVKAIAKQKKMKMSDVITEALELWTLYSQMQDIDPRALVVALSFMEHMMSRTVTLLVQVSQLFTSEMVKSMLELMANPPAPSLPQETEAKQYRSEIAKTLMPVMTQLLMQILMNVLKSMYPQVQVPSVSQPQALTTRTVKVEE